SLLTALREELEITSPKAGCHQGGCGACTVLVDGEARRSCLLPLAAVDGAAITTLEGLGTSDNLSSVQAAFDEHYAAQCGFYASGDLEALGLPADAPLLAADEVRYKGQPIAAVAAVDEDTAREAVSLIEIEYEERPAFFDMRKAMDPDWPQIHQWGPVYPHFG